VEDQGRMHSFGDNLPANIHYVVWSRAPHSAARPEPSKHVINQVLLAGVQELLAIVAAGCAWSASSR
jgi:hypothetical protein